jgi:hypothetical protein
MKKILLGSGLVVASIFIAVFSQPAAAADPRPKVISQESGSSQAITPAAKADLPNTYGILQSVDDKALVVRLLDGKTETYTLGPDTPPPTYSRGDIVGFNANKKKVATDIQAPPVERQFEGTVSAIDKDQVTLTSTSGETLTTTISPETMSRMGIATGKELTVTQFANTWATKVCNRVATPAPTPQAAPTPAPFQPTPPPPEGGGMPDPGTSGLW